MITPVETTCFDSGAYERSIIGEAHRSQFNDKLMTKIRHILFLMEQDWKKAM